MEFDVVRSGTGTNEWAERTLNICVGCSNNCRYCYAAAMADRFKQRERSEWAKEELTARAGITFYPARGEVVMFPSSHDISEETLEAYTRVAKLIVAGNNLLIVSKPRIKCIEKLLTELSAWKEKIQFRFTIGSIEAGVCAYWEPGAPLPVERIECLEMARNAGFSTSVSIEPMLEGREGAAAVVEMARPYVTDTIWIGKMNRVRSRVSSADGGGAAIDEIVRLQGDEEILKLVQDYRNDPVIRWKDSIKAVVEKYAQSDTGGKET